MKQLFTLIALLSLCICKAQNAGDSIPKPPGRKAVAYYETRKKISIPSYGYNKIETLINGIRPSSEEDADGDDYILKDDIYNRLSLQEKFTYNMIHAESYSQNCDVPEIEEDADKKIYAYPPGPFDDSYWSKRQTDFFKDNRDSVLDLMRASIERSNRVGSNYKQIIVDLKAIELIPVLVKVEKRMKNDHDILTVLNLLMKDGDYKPFTESASYEKLYGDEDVSYKSFIQYNVENEALILKRAMDFYHEQAR